MAEESEAIEDILAEARAELKRENLMSQPESSEYAEVATDQDDLCQTTIYVLRHASNTKDCDGKTGDSAKKAI